MGSASKNMNLMECLILLWAVSSYWFGYYKTHCLVGLWPLSHVDAVLIYLQSFDDFHLRNSIRSWYMWWPLGVQMMADTLWQWAQMMCNQSWFCAHIGSWRLGWHVSPLPLAQETFLLSSCWDFKLLSEIWSTVGGSAAAAHLQTFRLPIVFNHMPFLCSTSNTASPPSFSKSPLRALLKARSGSEVTLECKPQASPPAISLWKKGNEILQRTER